MICLNKLQVVMTFDYPTFGRLLTEVRAVPRSHVYVGTVVATARSGCTRPSDPKYNPD